MTKTNKGKGIVSKSVNINNLTIDYSLETFYKLFRKNSDIRRVIELKQENVGKNGYEVNEIKPDGTTEKVETNELYTFLNGEEFLEDTIKRIIVELEIFGNAYIEKIRNLSGNIIGFKILDARTMNIATDKYGNVLGYIQRVLGDAVTFSTDEIIHIKDKVDLDNPFFGISKIETLVYDLEGDEEASKSNLAFFKNNGIPSQLIILNDTNEDEDSINEDIDDSDEDEVDDIGLLTKTLKETFAGGSNSHKFMVAQNIKEIKNIGTSNSDMEYREYRKFNTERICAVMGVAKVLLNYTEGVNYSNADGQIEQFYESTIKPLELKITRLLTLLLREAFPDKLYSFNFNPDKTKIFKELVEINTKLISSGQMTINEARKTLNQPEYDEDYANKAIVTKNLVLLEDIDISSTVGNTEPAKSE